MTTGSMSLVTAHANHWSASGLRTVTVVTRLRVCGLTVSPRPSPDMLPVMNTIDPAGSAMLPKRGLRASSIGCSMFCTGCGALVNSSSIIITGLPDCSWKIALAKYSVICLSRLILGMAMSPRSACAQSKYAYAYASPKCFSSVPMMDDLPIPGSP